MAKDKQTFEERLKREWEREEIREEFQNKYEIFEAFKRAEAAGRIRYQITEKFSLDDFLELLKKPQYRELEAVKSAVSALQGKIAGKEKSGHEGPLKSLLRDIMGNKKMPFEDVCLALDGHVSVDQFDDKSLTFFYQKGDKDLIKEVKMPAIRKAHREIIETLQ